MEAEYQLTAEEQSRMEQIAAGLSYQYPYSDAVKVKSKYSVTELAGGSMVSSDEILLQKPEFTREHEGLTAAQRGSAMHLVMEHLDFAKALEHGGSYIRETVEKLRSTEALSEQEAKAIRIDQIQGFFAAPTGRRAAQARTLQKEREFILQKDVSGTQAIVQGIIDCFFEEEDGMVIIDYKNSYVGSEAEEEELRQRYGEQLCYLELRDPTDAYEWSFVAVPAQRKAGVLKRYGHENQGMAQLRAQAELGRKYLRELRREVTRLAMLADDSMDGGALAKAAEHLEEPELLELKRVYGAQAARRFPPVPQLRSRGAAKTEDETEFLI